jgi:hypothetical protein
VTPTLARTAAEDEDEAVRILLVHPPLLSPAVWRRLAPLLGEYGHEVATPRLRVENVAVWWCDAVRDVPRVMPNAETLVLHSGAGVLAPVLAPELPWLHHVVLLDAVMPAASGATVPGPEIRERVRSIAMEGVLPPWPAWWSPVVMAGLVPDIEDRQAITAEAPRLPEAFYDVAVPVPAHWEPDHCAYLRLSPAYDEALAEARVRGWRTEALAGRHLDLLARPEAVTRALVRLLS